MAKVEDFSFSIRITATPKGAFLRSQSVRSHDGALRQYGAFMGVDGAELGNFPLSRLAEKAEISVADVLEKMHNGGVEPWEH